MNDLLRITGFSGEQYSGATPLDIVEQMRASAWGGEKTDGVRGYMRQMAKRCLDWDGATIRTDSSEHFLQDLMAAGFIQYHRPK